MDKLHGREAKILAQSLSHDETVIGQYVGLHGQALVLTDRKALIIKAGFIAGQAFGGKASSYDYRTITSVEVRTGVMKGVFEIASGGVQGSERSPWSTDGNGAIKALNCIPLARRDYAKFQQAAVVIRERASASHAVAPPAPPPDRYEQLQKLGDLRAQGVLSDAEFEAEKARILTL